MKSYVIVPIIVASLVAVVACSDVGFESIPKLSCENVSRDQSTECVNKPDFVSVSFTFGVGDVDILFVDDNSGSMFREQEKMANAFPNFFQQISNLYYQIAIITTDVSASPNNSAPRAANGNGLFQDGKFLEFKDEQNNASGLTVIDYATPNVQSLFRGTIKRKETLDCDNSGFEASLCPSQDERGIYAANLAIKRGDKKFFRSGAHLALVVLSDEDERGAGGIKASDPQLEVNDLPETLVMNMKSLYPTKSLSVHSIVTNNETCRTMQKQYPANGGWPTLGFIGYQYMKLSNPSAEMMAAGNILPGSVGSICDSDYGSQLTNIGSYINNNTANAPKQLACLPEPGSIRVVTQPTGYESHILNNMNIDEENRATFFNLPLGVKVTFSYECPRF